jgi:hypothetical protein
VQEGYLLRYISAAVEGRFRIRTLQRMDGDEDGVIPGLPVAEILPGILEHSSVVLPPAHAVVPHISAPHISATLPTLPTLLTLPTK